MSNDLRLVFDDIIYSLQKSGGGSVYWTENIKRLNSLNIKHYCYDNADSNFLYDENNLPNLTKWSSRFLVLKRYLNLKFPNETEPFIFHSSMYRTCKNQNAVNITTIHDFTYEYFRRDLKSNLHKIQKKHAVMHSAGVICISENTKQDLLKFYPNYRGKIKVIHNGYNTEKYFHDPEIEKTKNILFVGARTDYKRFDLAVEIVKRLLDCKLIIIGGGELTCDEEKLLKQGLQNRYEKMSYVSDDDLNRLYNGAFFLCYPSEYEGFGIPLIEAQACGCPVVCQEKSSIPEVVGNTAVFINSQNIEMSMHKIKQLYDKNFYLNIQKRGFENIKRFSWDKCAEKIKQFYAEVFYCGV